MLVILTSGWIKGFIKLNSLLCIVFFSSSVISHEDINLMLPEESKKCVAESQEQKVYVAECKLLEAISSMSWRIEEQENRNSFNMYDKLKFDAVIQSPLTDEQSLMLFRATHSKHRFWYRKRNLALVPTTVVRAKKDQAGNHSVTINSGFIAKRDKLHGHPVIFKFYKQEEQFRFTYEVCEPPFAMDGSAIEEGAHTVFPIEDFSHRDSGGGAGRN